MFGEYDTCVASPYWNDGVTPSRNKRRIVNGGSDGEGEGTHLSPLPLYPIGRLPYLSRRRVMHHAPLRPSAAPGGRNLRKLRVAVDSATALECCTVVSYGSHSGEAVVAVLEALLQGVAICKHGINICQICMPSDVCERFNAIEAFAAPEHRRGACNQRVIEHIWESFHRYASVEHICAQGTRRIQRELERDGLELRAPKEHNSGVTDIDHTEHGRESRDVLQH